MFVSAKDIEAFTGLKRYSAQARFLAKHGIKFLVRDDGSIALRQDELDHHTLSKTGNPKPQDTWRENFYKRLEEMGKDKKDRSK